MTGLLVIAGAFVFVVAVLGWIAANEAPAGYLDEETETWVTR